MYIRNLNSLLRTQRSNGRCGEKKFQVIAGVDWSRTPTPTSPTIAYNKTIGEQND